MGCIHGDGGDGDGVGCGGDCALCAEWVQSRCRVGASVGAGVGAGVGESFVQSVWNTPRAISRKTSNGAVVPRCTNPC